MGKQGAERAAREQQPRVTDGRSPLWRAHNAWRVVTLAYALAWFAAQRDDYARPDVGAAVVVAMSAWTAFTVWRYWRPQGRTHRLVLADLVVCNLLYLCSHLVLTPDQLAASEVPSVVTIWHSSAVTVAAVRWGILGGGLSAAVASGSNFLLHQTYNPAMLLDTVLLFGTGLLVGLASDTARRATERLARALRTEAATAERERLARSIHDGVLQVLARVRHRGYELGGEAADIAKLAGEQEIALRALVNSAPAENVETGEVDLSARLRILRSSRVEVSVPGTAVELPAEVANGLDSVVREMISNVERHAGADVGAWVLLEDVAGEVVLSVRDDGPGIPEGRLEAAEAEGRMGVTRSIRGRVEALGGSITLDTGPGEGTEWEVRVPRPGERRSGRAHARRLGGGGR